VCVCVCACVFVCLTFMQVEHGNGVIKARFGSLK
jgi:hypothetical protein